jgi:hypothetical protein
MAQTRKKRRRKHRGTQGGRIDSGNRRRARPQSREEARARARSKRGGGQSRLDRTPSWRSATIRGVIAAAAFFVLLVLAFKRSPGQAAFLSLFMLVFYIPTGYYIDQMMWRRRERSKMREGGG